MTSVLNSETLITLVSMCILPQTAILVTFEAMAASKTPHWSYDLRFEIRNLDYPGIYVHIAVDVEKMLIFSGPQALPSFQRRVNRKWEKW